MLGPGQSYHGREKQKGHLFGHYPLPCQHCADLLPSSTVSKLLYFDSELSVCFIKCRSLSVCIYVSLFCRANLLSIMHHSLVNSRGVKGVHVCSRCLPVQSPWAERAWRVPELSWMSLGWARSLFPLLLLFSHCSLWRLSLLCFLLICPWALSPTTLLVEPKVNTAESQHYQHDLFILFSFSALHSLKFSLKTSLYPYFLTCNSLSVPTHLTIVWLAILPTSHTLRVYCSFSPFTPPCHVFTPLTSFPLTHFPSENVRLRLSFRSPLLLPQSPCHSFSLCN